MLSSTRTEQVRVTGLVLASLLAIAALVSLALRGSLASLLLLGASIALWLRAWVGRRLSVVALEGDVLRVSSESGVAHVPLAQVVSVTRVWFPGAQRIYLELGGELASRREIVFEAPFEARALVGRHPLVDELRALSAGARAAAGS